MTCPVDRETFVNLKREAIRSTYTGDQKSLSDSAADDGVSTEQFLTNMAEELADLCLELCGDYYL